MCSGLLSSGQICHDTTQQDCLVEPVVPEVIFCSHLEIQASVVGGNTKGQSSKRAGVWAHHQESHGSGYDRCISFCVSHLIAHLLSCLQDTLPGATARRKRRKKDTSLEMFSWLHNMHPGEEKQLKTSALIYDHTEQSLEQNGSING